MSESKVVNFGRTLTENSALHIYTMADRPGIRIQIEFDGKPGDWMEFETAEKAWGLVASLTAHVEEAFPGSRPNTLAEPEKAV